jgi:hypothetical protein
VTAQTPPAPAVTAPAPAAQTSIFQGVLDWAGSTAGVMTIITVLFGGLGLLLASNKDRKRQVGLGIYHAFHTIEDASSEWPENTTLRKAEEALKAADQYMIANGWRPLKPEEQSLAQLQFTAMNGQMKAQEKIQANALQAAIAATSAPAMQAAATAQGKTVVPQTPRAL